MGLSSDNYIKQQGLIPQRILTQQTERQALSLNTLCLDMSTIARVHTSRSARGPVNECQLKHSRKHVTLDGITKRETASAEHHTGSLVYLSLTRNEIKSWPNNDVNISGKKNYGKRNQKHAWLKTLCLVLVVSTCLA